MKYGIDRLIGGIAALSKDVGPATIMEVCGTHTANIRRFGLPSILPDTLKLVSGPGCPVCVTPQEDIAAAMSIADRDNVIFASFGDMLRVPCGKGSLYSLYEKGRDVRFVVSPMDALKLAGDNPDKQVVYFGIGFETTAPHTAALVEAAEKRDISNLSVLCAHKTMPRAIEALLGKRSGIDALLCPGHVAAVIGADAFSFIPERLQLPAAVAGFEAYDILAAILSLMAMLKSGRPDCVNMYPGAVESAGNPVALRLMEQVLEPCGCVWRGLGEIPMSGLKLRGNFERFDARRRFQVEDTRLSEPEGCLCAQILRGERVPTDCACFGGACTPDEPVGPCMVSAEGACAAYYRYKEN